MAYFTFKKGNKSKEAGIILDKKGKKKLFYINEDKELSSSDSDSDNDLCCRNCTKGCGIDSFCCKKCRGRCFKDLQKKKYDKLFKKELEYTNNQEMPYIELESGESMLPVPTIRDKGEKKRDNIFISGPEGVGKSTWASHYIEIYRNIYPKAKFFIFSGISKDTVLDKLKPIRIKLDEELVENPISVDEFPDGAIVLFDDVDTLEDAKVKKEVLKLRDRLLEKGRHKGIYVLSLTHNPTAGKDTKMSLLESSSIVLFPKGGDSYHMERVLKHYLGYNPKIIPKLLKLNTRWIQCHKRYPKFILHEKGCFIP